MLLTSNPFDRLLPGAADGRDLNPLLQDPGMVIHPPMLYMGYVGFSVAFAFAVAALIGGNLDADLGALDAALDHRGLDLPHPRHRARQLVGLLRARLGRLVVLGPGRERLVHAVAGRHRADPLARRHREARRFKAWTVLLAILAFSLSLLGTFLVRSGVLSSVHAFATDPRRGLFILAFLVVVIGASLALYAWRAPQVGLGARFELRLARDAAARQQRAAGGRLRRGAARHALPAGRSTRSGMGKISVGPPYFDTVFVPLMAPLVLPDGRRPAGALEAGASCPTSRSRLRWAAGAGGRRRRCATAWLRRRHRRWSARSAC